MAYDPDQYLEEHRAYWQGFMKLTVVTTVGVVLLLVLMALFIL